MGPHRGIDDQEAKTILVWQKQREQGQSQKSIPEIENFLKKKPSSRYFQAARLELAMSCLEVSNMECAEPLFRSVREVTLGREASLAAKAEWGLSFVAERQGDDLTALGHVMSAENLSVGLEPELVRVEIPARKAILFQKRGRSAEAIESLRRADRGFKELLANPQISYNPDWTARLQYQMGNTFSDPTSGENFERHMAAHKLSQIYLLRTLASGHVIWAPRAGEALQKKYSDLWGAALAPPPASGLDPLVAARENRQRQTERLVDLLEALEKAQAYAPVREASANQWQLEFHGWLDELRDKTRAILHSSSESMVLTEESKRLNGVRRAGRIQDAISPDSNPKKSMGKDPNL